MCKSEKGDVTELRCLAALRELGFTVSVPWGSSAAYDIVADAGGKLCRIQCKTSRPAPSGLEFNTYSMAYNMPSRGYAGRADYFMTCYDDHFYMIPVAACSVGKKRLKLHGRENVTNSCMVASAEQYNLTVVAPRLFAEADTGG